MKKYQIIECLLYVICLISYIVFLVLNKDKGIYFIFKSYYIVLGFIVPVIHIVMILLKQILVKSYLGYKYDSIMTYFVVIINCLFSIIFRRFITEEIFNKTSCLYFIFEVIVYIVLIVIGIKLEKNEKNKKASIIKNNK